VSGILDQNQNDYLSFRSALQTNRDVFLLNHRRLVEYFLSAEGNFLPLYRALSTRRDSSGASHVSLIPFVHLFQRQVTVAFDLMATDECYQGWVLVRPGLEALLMVGKWLDDPEFAAIWSEKNERWKEYRKAYSGSGFHSSSLDRSPDLQRVLSRINDEFVHANPDYYSRHVGLIPDGPDGYNLKLDWFEDDDVQEAGCLALLNMTLVAQETLCRAVQSRLEGSEIKLDVTAREFEDAAGARVRVLSKDEDCSWILRDLGMLSACIDEDDVDEKANMGGTGGSTGGTWLDR